MSATTKRGAPIDHVVAVDEDEGGFTLSMDDGTTQRIPMRATNARTQTWLRALRAHRSQQAQQKQSTTEEEPQQFAAGGVVPDNVSAQPSKSPKRPRGAPIDHVTAIDEDADGFTLHMDDGSTTRVPMRATNARTQTWLRALRAHKATRASEQQEEELRGPQQFATGGLVPRTAALANMELALRGAAESYLSDPNAPPLPESPTGAGLPVWDKPAAESVVQGVKDMFSHSGPGGPLVRLDAPEAPPTPPRPSRTVRIAEPGATPSIQSGPRTLDWSQIQVGPTRSSSEPGETQLRFTDTPDPVVARPAPPGPGPMAPAAPPLPATTGGLDAAADSALSRFNQAADAERAGQQKLGQIESQHQQSIATARAHTQDAVRRLHERRDQLLEDHNRQWDLQRQKVAAGEINPRRFWTDQSIPAKISTAIGLFLGGLGAGMTRSPNHALQLFQKFIDDDINAQREALARDERMLETIRQQGVDIEAQFARREAELLAALAGELELKAAQFASREAIENAKVIAAQLEQRAITIGQQIAEREAEAEFQQQMRPLEIAGAVSDLQTASVQRQAARHRMRMEQQQLAAGTEAERQKAIILDQFINQGLPTDRRGRAAYRLLPQEDRDVAVIVGDRYVPAISKTAAEEQRRNEALVKPVLDALEKMRQFRARFPKGQWWGRLGDSEAYGEMKGLHDELVAAVLKLQQGAKPSDFDWKVVDRQIPDLTKWSPTQHFDGRLRRLDESFRAQIDASRRSNLLFVPGAAQSFTFREDRPAAGRSDI